MSSTTLASRFPEAAGFTSIETGIRLLEALQSSDGPLALKDLSAQSEMDPSSAHRYLASFVRCGLVRQEADSRYDFGPLALQIGLAAMRRIEPVQLAEQALPELVAETGYTALLAVWSNRGPTVVNGCLVRSPRIGVLVNVPADERVQRWIIRRLDAQIGEATADEVGALLRGGR